MVWEMNNGAAGERGDCQADSASAPTAVSFGFGASCSLLSAGWGP